MNNWSAVLKTNKQKYHDNSMKELFRFAPYKTWPGVVC